MRLEEIIALRGGTAVHRNEIYKNPDKKMINKLAASYHGKPGEPIVTRAVINTADGNVYVIAGDSELLHNDIINDLLDDGFTEADLVQGEFTFKPDASFGWHAFLSRPGSEAKARNIVKDRYQTIKA